MNLFPGIDEYEGLERSAEISECGRYRWCLRRSWKHGGNGKTICFVLLNPSVADAAQDDPTLRRCMAFTRAWGFSSLSVRNLFPFRATDPADLRLAEDPTGGARGDVELVAAKTADLVVCAWGANGDFRGRGQQALKLLAGKPLHCLKLTKHGHPQHPLYMSGNAVPVLFKMTLTMKEEKPNG